MKLKIKDLNLSSGGPQIVILYKEDAQKLDIYTSDRIRLKIGKKSTVCVVDITDEEGLIKQGEIGLFDEVFSKIGRVKNRVAEVEQESKPDTLKIIKKKMDGHELSEREIKSFIKDVVDNKFSDVELSYFVSAVYINKMTFRETVSLSKSLVNCGKTINLPKKTFDKHCIGGIPNNRTTMIVVPIIAALGYTIVKTSTRAITSPAGTSDTVETLAPVTFTKEKIKKIVRKTNGCMVWGGAVDIASADDRFIKLEHPLRLDPEGLLIASILAKKKAVGATYVIIDIPVGKTAKIENTRGAMHLKRKLIKVGKKIGLNVKVVITNGSQPVGRGVGPILEARDVLWVLERDPRASKDLREKSVMLASKLLSMGGLKRSKKKVTEVLNSGKALKKFQEIIHIQGGKKQVKSTDLELSKYTRTFLAKKAGRVKSIDNKLISKAALMAGAPKSKKAGLYLHAKIGKKVKKGEILLMIYSENKKELSNTIKFLSKNNPYTIR